MEPQEVRVTRGMVVVARVIDIAQLTWTKAAELAKLDGGHLGKILKGSKSPAGETMDRFRTAFGTDANLWLEEASAEERAEWEERMASMRSRAVETVGGRAAS